MKIVINEEEKKIIIELLKKMHTEISTEIHHCKTNDFKTHLKDQLNRVETLIEKLNAA
jgi:hypothetical protein